MSQQRWSRLIFSTLFATAVNASAQTVTLRAIDGRKVTVREGALRSFAASDAEKEVGRIVAVAGLKVNFKVAPTDDPQITNAAAMVDEQGTTRYILYAPAYVAAVSRGGQGAWAVRGVLAHEIGHHANFHTMDRGTLTSDASKQQELDADEFAGMQLARLGASQSEALAMLDGVDDVDSYTHPRRSAREVVVRRGWCAANARPALGFAPSGAGGCAGGPSQPVASAAPTGSAPAIMSGNLVSYDFRQPGVQLSPIETGDVTMKSVAGGWAMIDKPRDGGPYMHAIDTKLPARVEIEVTATVVGWDNRGGAGWGVGFGDDQNSPVYFVVIAPKTEQIGMLRMDGSKMTPIGIGHRNNFILKELGQANTITIRLDGTKVEVRANGVHIFDQELPNAVTGRMVLMSSGHQMDNSPSTIVFVSARATAM